jgi:hypothetical protein
MRRPICLVEPSVAVAGEKRSWKFLYTPTIALPAGTRLKFDPLIQMRPIDWQLPECESRGGENLIWLKLPSDKTVHAKEVAQGRGAPGFFYEFTLPSEVKLGETLAICLGCPESSVEAQHKKGNRAQSLTQRRRPFHLYIDPKGKGDYKDPEIFTIDVRGGVLHTIRIIAPSFVSKNRRFDVLVRFEDLYGNLTSQAPAGMLIELSYEQLRENLNWKLFVPETGFLLLPNLYFNEVGVYRIQLRSSVGNKVFYSSPIKCVADSDQSIFWGLLHGESERVDATENIELYLRHMRDERSLQFVATSPFEDAEETSAEDWKAITTQVAEYNEESRFTTLLGFQWQGDETEGLRQFIYWKDNKPLLRKKDSKNSHLKKIYKSSSLKEFLSILCMTMVKGCDPDFTQLTPEFERVIEIYNAWGCCECTAKEGNLKPITASGKDGLPIADKGSVRNALNQNARLGFVAGGFDDRGFYSSLYSTSQKQYTPGLTAIIATEQTREGLMQALYNRSCYATTGARIVLGFFIAGASMGSELNTKNKPGLAYNRHITGFVCGTGPIKEVQIIRNGELFHKFHPGASQIDFAHDDSSELSQIALSSPDERPPFAYYYLRVIQEDEHMAFSSPIWVDLTESISVVMQKKPKKK